MKRLSWTLVLPLTIISFTIFTKWWYVLPVDAPDTMMAGFPIIYVCSGWHTSLSLQIFITELFVDFLSYTGFWFIMIYSLNRYLLKIKLHKIITISLLSISGLFLIGMIFIGVNSNNLFYIKRPFDIEVLTTGYKFIWNGNTRPANFDFDEYEKNKLNK